MVLIFSCWVIALTLINSFQNSNSPLNLSHSKSLLSYFTKIKTTTNGLFQKSIKAFQYPLLPPISIRRWDIFSIKGQLLKSQFFDVHTIRRYIWYILLSFCLPTFLYPHNYLWLFLIAVSFYLPTSVIIWLFYYEWMVHLTPKSFSSSTSASITWSTFFQRLLAIILTVSLRALKSQIKVSQLLITASHLSSQPTAGYLSYDSSAQQILTYLLTFSNVSLLLSRSSTPLELFLLNYKWPSKW